MRVVMFYHSLVSDWNHGNAHFLRGIVTELQSRGHVVQVMEPSDGWSRTNLVAEQGEDAVGRFRAAFPGLESRSYELDTLDLDEVLDGADLVLVHEWNEHELVRRVGEKRRTGGFRLFFHDTHHRSATDPASMGAYDLAHYDGVLAFGNVVRDSYLRNGWARAAFTWHEAADIRVFRPRPADPAGDVVWVGNWGDDERARELRTFLLDPVRELTLSARVHGVRYPQPARAELAASGVEYAGYLPNFEVPAVFGTFRVTVHVPRRPYVKALPGIPTIRPFEAMACGIPLLSAPWDDVEGLFTAGSDYLIARDGTEMVRHLRSLLHDPQAAKDLGEHGRRTILERHTCAHRVDELLGILKSLS